MLDVRQRKYREMDIIEIVKTPLFWVVSAVASIALSVVGNLVTPKVADWISQRSNKKRDKGTLRRARFLGEVVIRVADPSKIIGTKLDSIHAFLLACISMLFALILSTAATILEWFLFSEFIRLATAILSIPVMWFSYYLAAEGVRWRKVAILAEKRIAQEMTLANPENRDNRPIDQQMDEWDRQHFGITLDETQTIMKERIEMRKEPNKS